MEKKSLLEIVREIEEAFFDIPFGNSRFQNYYFVAGSQHTPARAYRAVGLRLMNRIRALKEAMYNRAKEDVDIEELQEKLKNGNLSKYDKKRIELELKFKLENRRYIDKLINDCLNEILDLYVLFKKLPKYTRDQFEAEERKHFEIRLKKQALGVVGALESLDAMGEDVTRPIEFNEVKQLEGVSLQEIIEESLKLRSEIKVNELFEDKIIKEALEEIKDE